jgi:DNA repair photolyase
MTLGDGALRVRTVRALVHAIRGADAKGEAMSERADYEEKTCKTGLNRVKGMPFRWSLNPYRGCVHGCHYCFARRFHIYIVLHAEKDFAGKIFVKTNLARVLREELWMPGWRRETVALGTAIDPYQPIEGKYRLSRQCLEALADRRNPVGLVTKGPMVIRDIDVLTSIAARAECTVCVSITTLDDDLARRLEPTTAPPSQRLTAVAPLARAGIRVGVLVAPMLPGITDDEACLEAVVRGAAAHGASFIGGRVLQLREGTKEHFLDYLARDFPELSTDYRWMYPGSMPPRRVQAEAEGRLVALRDRFGLSGRETEPDETPPRQLTLTLA